MSENPKSSLKESLSRFREMQEARSYTLRDLMQAIDEKGFGLLLVLLALPSALPVPAAGYSTPFGLLILSIGIQMFRGRQVPWLPEKANKIILPHKFFQKMIAVGVNFLGLVERFISPRLKFMTQRTGHRALAILVILMALLMILPIPGTNTIPAFVVFLVGVSLSEEDGLLALAAFLAGLFAVAIYAAAIYFCIYFFKEYGWDGIDHFIHLIIDTVKSWLGLEPDGQ